MPLSVWLASAAIVASLPVLYWALHTGPSVESTVRDNLSQRGIGSYRDIQLSRSVHDRLLGPAVAALARRGRRLTTDGVVDALTRQLELAGLAGQWTVEQVLALRVALAMVGAACGLVRLSWSGVSPGGIGLAVLFVVIGYLAPSAWLSRRARDRQAQIEVALPDTIDQVAIGVEAGLAFDGALARAARNGKGPLAEELLHALRDIQLGVRRDTAFDRLLARTDVPDLRQLVIAIRQTERYGLPVSRTLRVQTSELREKRRMRAEERAMKVPVKIVFPLVFCILPALFVVVLGPAALEVLDSFK